MGIRKIEDEIDLKEAMKKKAAELKMKEMEYFFFKHNWGELSKV